MARSTARIFFFGLMRVFRSQTVTVVVTYLKEVMFNEQALCSTPR